LKFPIHIPYMIQIPFQGRPTASRPTEFTRYLLEGDMQLTEGAVGGCIGGAFDAYDVDDYTAAGAKQNEDGEETGSQNPDGEGAQGDEGTNYNTLKGYSRDKKYADILLDPAYMEQMIKKTDEVIEEKKEQKRVWAMVQKWVRRKYLNFLESW
jgi:hypothetical protein